jgi:hypothetical protein
VHLVINAIILEQPVGVREALRRTTFMQQEKLLWARALVQRLNSVAFSAK